MKKWLIFFVFVLALGGLIVWRLHENKTKEATGAGNGRGPSTAMRRGGGPASVEVARPQIRDIVNSFTATGTVESIEHVTISPRVSGRIEHLVAREGDRVKRGQVLVRLDQTDVLAQVRQQEANLAEARYRLAQARLNQTPTDTAVATQIRQQEANVASAAAELRQAQTTRAAQLEATKATLEDAQSKIDSVTATVANTAARVKSAQANLDNATAKYDRIFGLYKQGFVAAQDVDDAKTTVSMQQSALEVAQGEQRGAQASLSSAQAQKRTVEEQGRITRAKADADFDAAEARVTQAKAALEYAKANAAQSPAFKQNLEALQAGIAVAQASLDTARAKVNDTILRSPLDGVVTARTQDPGGMASPGQALLTLQSLHSLWATVAVPEEICAKLHLGQPVDVAFDALGGRAFPATVGQINPAADVQSRQFTVRVLLNNAGNRFSPGMFARVTLILEKATQVVAIPREALKHAKDVGDYVVVARKDQTAHLQPVVPGISDASWVAVTGLSADESVVTMSAMRLNEGQKIRAGGRRPGGAGGRPGMGGPEGPGGRPGPGRPEGAGDRPGGSGGPGGSGMRAPGAGGGARTPGAPSTPAPAGTH